MRDLEILNRFHEGDPRAFEMIYKEFYVFVYFRAVKMLSRSQDAKDVRSLCFMRLWNIHSKIRFLNYAQLYGWLNLTLHRICIDFIRHRRMVEGKADKIYHICIDEQKQKDVFEATDAEAAVIDRILKQIDKLPEKYKRVFIMRCYDELKYTEIAKKLGITLSNAKKRYKRAVELIKYDRKTNLPRFDDPNRPY
jgi:RNA polymerase sigma-70 factor (ECF subfamily)